LSLEILL